MNIVAEIGLNHDGNFNLIYEMIKQAKQSGYASNTQKTKSFIVRFMPGAVRRKLHAVLTRLRDMLDKILE